MEASTQLNGALPKPRKQRSPSYPGIGLQAALGRAKVLYREIGRGPAHVETALRALGYGPKSGGGRVILSAIKKFGLLSDEGSKDRRQVQLTPLALKIILDEREESPERDEAIRTAALAPSIHRELLERYPAGLPGNDTLTTYLRVERAFTDSAVKEFVPQFRATVAFAKLLEGGTVPPPDEDKSGPSGSAGIPSPEDQMTPPAATVDPPTQDTPSRQDPPPPPAGDAAAPLPVNANLIDGGRVTIHVSQQLSEEAWEQLMAVLAAHKPGLIIRPKPPGQ